MDVHRCAQHATLVAVAEAATEPYATEEKQSVVLIGRGGGAAHTPLPLPGLVNRTAILVHALPRWLVAVKVDCNRPGRTPPGALYDRLHAWQAPARTPVITAASACWRAGHSWG